MDKKNFPKVPKEGLIGLLALLVLFLIPLFHSRPLQDQTELPKASLAALSAFLFCAVIGLQRGMKGGPFLLPLRIFFGLVLWQALSWPFAASPELGVEGLLGSFSSLAWLYLTWHLLKTRIWRRRALTALILSGFISAIYGISQYEAIEPGSFPQGLASLFSGLADRSSLWGFLGPLDQTDAPGSFFGHTNVAAEFVALSAVLALVRVLQPLIIGPGRARAMGGALFWALVLAPMILFMLRSGSRSVMLAFGLVGLSLWLHFVVAAARRKPLFGSLKRHLLVHAGLLSLFALVGALSLGPLKTSPRSQQEVATLKDRLTSAFDSESTTVRERLDLWLNTFSMIQDHPVFGVGIGNFRVVYPRYADSRRSHDQGRYGLRRQPVHPHNEYLALMAENGILALVLMGAFLLSLIGPTVWQFSAFRREGQPDEAEALAALAAMGLILITSLFAFPLQQTATRISFVVMAAIMMRTWPKSSLGAHSANSSWAPFMGFASSLLLIIAAAHFRAEYKSSEVVRQIAQPKDSASLTALDVARALDQAMARTPWRLDLALLRAQMNVSAGLLGSAREDFLRILELQPSLTNAWMGLARVELADGNLATARKSLSQALNLQPREPRLRLSAGDIYRAMGDRRLAVEQYEESLKLDPIGPDRLVAFLSLSRLYSEADQQTSALHWLEKARALAPRDPVVAEARARFMERHNPGSDAAIESWRVLREQRPHHAEAQLRCGQAEMRAADYKAALASFEAAYMDDPTLTVALYERGAAQAALGYLKEARGSLIECIRKSGLPESRDAVLFMRAQNLIRAIEDRAVEEGLMENRR